MRFVETSVFSGQLHEHLSDDGYRSLQLALVLRPEQGALIPGSGGSGSCAGLFAARGARGLRVIYYWDVEADTIYLLFLYPKNQQEDLTPAQLKLLRQIVQEVLK